MRRRSTDARVEDVSVGTLEIPTDSPEGDGTLGWSTTTIVVVQLRAGGMTGTGWTYGPPACADVVRDQLADIVVGRRVADVPGTWLAMVRATRNATRGGVVGYAISAVDVACWDLKARLLGVALADLFGRAHEAVPVYGSGGFTTYSDEQMATQLRHWTQGQSIGRVKIKIGESRGRRTDRDIERVHLARQVVGPGVELYVDANGAYTAKQAIRVEHEMREARVTWYEEPVSSDDLAGLDTVRRAVTADVAAGEYGTDVTYFTRMCPVVDCIQADATRCGGYTEWLRAAAVAAGQQLEISGHCAPNLHAAVAAAVPNLRHLEWFHDHVRIEQLLFTGALDPTGGSIVADRDRPGHGMALRPEKATELGLSSS